MRYDFILNNHTCCKCSRNTIKCTWSLFGIRYLYKGATPDQISRSDVRSSVPTPTFPNYLNLLHGVALNRAVFILAYLETRLNWTPWTFGSGKFVGLFATPWLLGWRWPGLFDPHNHSYSGISSTTSTSFSLFPRGSFRINESNTTRKIAGFLCLRRLQPLKKYIYLATRWIVTAFCFQSDDCTNCWINKIQKK